MPLKLELKQGDRIIINGAVIEAASPHTKIVVHNQASILRAKEILSEDQAITPATRVYYALQSAYLFPEHANDYLTEFTEYTKQYLNACPSAVNIVENIKDEIAQGKLYRALKCARELVVHQQGVLHEFEVQLADLAEQDENDWENEENGASEIAPEDITP